jgi:ATP-binding cassette subfamily B (MDR/TAP) protein 1
MALVILTGTTVLNRYSKESAECTKSAASVAEGAIKAVQVVQAFDAFEYLTNDHQTHLAQAMEFGILKAVAGAVLLGSVFFIAYAANALAFWEGSQLVKSDRSSGGAGTIYAIVFLILDASFVIGQAGPFIQSFSQAASAGRRILDLIDYPEIPIDIYSKIGLPASQETFGEGKEIVFTGVSFSYPARPMEKVLNSVSFRIRTGTTVGIVGASGSGKSTIAALLLRLYDSCDGCITIDGHSISDFNLASLRSAMALVDQDPAVFSGSIYTNIRDGYKGPELPEVEMRGRCVKAAKAADAWSFIELLPNGMDTWLGEPAGTKLSGGQKQRVCLARALVSDPPLLVLDEATSALDTISEQSILDSLAASRSLGHRITVMIAHRLASVKHADNIIVMGKGKVLEQGSHESLMSNIGGAYYQLIDAQKFAPDASSESFFLDRNEAGVEKLAEEDMEVAISPSSSKEILFQSSKPFGTFTIINRCLALTRSKLFFTLLALLGSLATGGLILGESIIFGHVVQLLNSSVPSGQVDFYCLMFFVVSLIALAGYVTSGSCFGLVSEHLIFRTRDLSLRTILRQDMEWFMQAGRSTSSLISVTSMDAGHLSGLSGVIIGTIVSALVSVVGGAILAFIVAWKIAIVLFATSPVVISAGFLRLRVLSKLEEKNHLAYTDAASLATEACSSIRTVAALGTEKVTSERFYRAVDKFQKQTFRDMVLGNVILAFALSVT